MTRLKWEKPDERTCCYSRDKARFFGSYWKLCGSWYAHINPRELLWYIREFPLDTGEKEIKKECQKFINHYKEEVSKWIKD